MALVSVVLKQVTHLIKQTIRTCLGIGLFIILSSHHGFSQMVSTGCPIYINTGPLDRATGSSEVNIINGLYSGLAQRYNNVSGSITGVRFWARVPASVGTAQTVRVYIYQENVGFPGTVLGQTTVSVPSSNALTEINATLSSPVNVNNNIIVSVEPFNVATANVWVMRNQDGNPGNNYIGDGGNLYLNLIKQGVTWFKELANGDPSWDFDFLIMPLRTENVTAAFTFNTVNYNATFSNSSASATSYLWDFGDGMTSVLPNPSHTYAATGPFTVKLIAFSSDSTCYDSLIQVVNISLTGIEQITYPEMFISEYNSNDKQLMLKAEENISIAITTVLGVIVERVELTASIPYNVDVSHYETGLYLISAGGFARKQVIY